MTRRASQVALLFGAMAVAAPALAQTADAAITRAKALTGIAPCSGRPTAPDASSDVTVCANAANQRYRLPLPVERDPSAGDGPVAGEPRSAAASLIPFAACGPFAGQRDCAKAEARRYGYGGGRDPLSIGVKLLTQLINPDAALAPTPATIPSPQQ